MEWYPDFVKTYRKNIILYIINLLKCYWAV